MNRIFHLTFSSSAVGEILSSPENLKKFGEQLIAMSEKNKKYGGGPLTIKLCTGSGSGGIVLTEEDNTVSFAIIL